MLGILAVVGRKALFSRQKRSPSNRNQPTTAAISNTTSTETQLPQIEVAEFPFPASPRHVQQYFKRQRSKIIEETKHMTAEKQELAINRLVLEAGNDLIQVKNERADMKHDKVELGRQQLTLDRVNAEIDLRKYDLELTSKEMELDHKGNSLLMMMKEIDLGKRKIRLDEQKIKLLHDSNMLELNTTMSDLKMMQKEIVLSEHQLRTDRKAALIDIREAKLDQYESQFNLIYDLKVKALKLQEKENRVRYQERKNSLDVMYQKTLLAVDRFRNQPFKETAIQKFQREDAYFKLFMEHHFSWIGLT